MQIINTNNAVLFTAALACLPALTAAAPVTQDGAVAGLDEPLFDIAELNARAAALNDNVDLADEQLFEMSDLEAREYNADTIAELEARDIDPQAIMKTLGPLGKSILKAILKLSTSEGAELAQKLGVPIVGDAVKLAGNAADQALSKREPLFPALAIPIFKGLLGGAVRVGAGAARVGAGAARKSSGDLFQAGAEAAASQREARAISADQSFEFADYDVEMSELLERDVGADLKEVAKGASPAVLNILKSLAKLTKGQATQIAKQLNVPGVADAVDRIPVNKRDVEAANKIIANAPEELKSILKAAANLALPEAKKLAEHLGLPMTNYIPESIKARDPKMKAKAPKTKAPKTKNPKEKEPKADSAKPTTTKNQRITTSTSVPESRPTSDSPAEQAPPPAPAPPAPAPPAPAPAAPAQPPSMGEQVNEGFNTAANVINAFANLGGAVTGGAGQMLGGVLQSVFNF
jgi:hypothetical protein